MNPSRIFILRPVATSLVMLALLLAGVIGYRLLPVSALPQVEYPTIEVTTFYPGASPEVMTTAVTAPLERQFGEMPGLEQMTSNSSAGASVITLQFALGLPLDVAEQEVQAAINAGSNLLPNDLPAPPVYAKVNPADAPILTLAATSKTLPLTEVHDLIDTKLAQKLSQLPGVGLVRLGGGQRKAVRVRFDPRALAAYGLNIDDLRTTIATANVNQPKGGFHGPTRSYVIGANDQLTDPAQFGDIVVAYREGAPVRLADVAEVVSGPENDELSAWMNASPAIVIDIQRQPGANVIAVAEEVKRLLPQLTAGLPPAIEIRVLTDRTETIRASVRDVQIELALAVGLVVLVIFAFLRNWRATLIPSLSAPLSLIGAFGAMALAGYSLNNLSLMALTIATGFVVDDAIVVIENITRRLEDGEPPTTAALRGSEQIGFTIISLTLSLIAVLIPLLFMGDVVGRLFREFAVTLAVTILISGAVSLTLTPMLCALLLRAVRRPHDPRAERERRGWFQAVIDRYARALDWVLDRQTATLVAAGLTLALTVALYITAPKGFFPAQDTGVIVALVEAPGAVSFREMAARQEALAAAFLEDQDVASLSSAIGADGVNTALNTGRMLINLKPLRERDDRSPEIMRRLRARAERVEGVTAHLQASQELTISARVSRAAYQLVVESADPDALDRWVPLLAERLAALPELANVADDSGAKGLGAMIVIDRDTAARFGISVATVSNALYDAFGQRIISTIYTQSNQYRVILEAAPAYQSSLAALQSIWLPSSIRGREQVPLTAIAAVVERPAPLRIGRSGQFPAATIAFDVAPESSLDAAIAAIERVRADLAPPESLLLRFEGAALAFQGSLTDQLLLILAAIVTVYIVLGVLYESFVHPVTILSTLPSAGLGALLALRVTGGDLDVIAVIGIVLLIGIVKKNAIMMVDFALEAQRERALSPRAAIREACLLRLRPIVMTTMTALFAALPLMLGEGAGSELRHPLGVTIFGGLLVSQALTLFTTPVIYLAFDRLTRRGGAAVRERAA